MPSHERAPGTRQAVASPSPVGLIAALVGEALEG